MLIKAFTPRNIANNPKIKLSIGIQNVNPKIKDAIAFDLDFLFFVSIIDIVNIAPIIIFSKNDKFYNNISNTGFMEILDNKIPTGSKILDLMLDGGYEKDVITTIYGPAGSGKTVLCLLCSINIARSGKKVIYVDSEGGFSLERFKQITTHMNQNFTKILNNIVLLRPTRFDEQKKSF